MESEQQVGSVGTANESIAAGKASAKFSGAQSALNGLLKVNYSIDGEIDLGSLVDFLQAEVEKALPAGKAIEDFAFAEIKAVVLKIGS